MSCSNSNCAEIQAKYNESIKEGQILCRKMKDYQKELSQYEAWMKESDRQQRDACIMHEATFRQLISDLDALVRCEDTERKEGHRSVQLEAFQLLSSNLIKTYRALKIKEFDSKYETMLTSLFQSLSMKMTENSSKKTTDVNNNASQTAANVSSTPQLSSSSATGELIGRVNMQISEDLSEFRQKTQMCREKLSQQRQMIQSLLNKISMSSSTTSSTLTSTQSAQIKSPPTREGREDHSVSSNSETSTTSSCTTSSSSSFQAQLAARANNTDYKHIAETYMCPKCQIQVDSRKIPFKKLESHIKKCDPTKLGCIFCLKLFEQSEQVLFENHVQKHLLKQTLERSRAVTISNSSNNQTPPTPQNQSESQSRLSNQSSLSNNSI